METLSVASGVLAEDGVLVLWSHFRFFRKHGWIVELLDSF